MNEFQLLNDKKELANSQDILRDVLSGDPNALLLLDDKNLDKNAIKLALDFIMNNNTISDKEKQSLLCESWRINYRDKPPTPEEFITPKYLGSVANHTYDRIKRVFVEFMNPEKPYRNLILYPHISWGKALPKNTKVQTPSGPVEMGDLKVGDLICNTYGETSKVLAKADFPDEDVYRFTFADGRETLVCGNHNWKAFTSTYQNKIWDEESKSYKNSDVIPCWKVVTTNEIIEDLKKNPKHTWKIPLPKPVYYEEKQHMISPYAIGAFLGDGCFSNACNIVGDDLEIHERILRENQGLCTFHDLTEKKNQGKMTVKYSTNLNANFRKELMRLGLKNKKCDGKFIPKEYLYDSIENRIALLQGLMDTDGTVGNNGPKAREDNRVPRPSFWTSSEQLAKNITTLVRSLGGICRVYKQEKGKSATANYDAYIVNFNFPDNSFYVFYLKRKQELLNIYFNREKKYKQKNKPKYISIKSIEKVDQKGGQCIEVDSGDHCFLAEDYIVTHNSYLATLINIYICACVSLMRNPWKFFGLNPASVIVQFLCSYSLKKSSELLLEPYMNILESSPFFEKVHSREKMKKATEDYEHMEQVDKIFYTTASPTSELTFTGGMNIKTISNPQGLLGASCVSCTFSELAFFTLAGKALYYNELIKMEDGSSKPIIDLKPGDKLYPINDQPNEVEKIMWEGFDEMYEIEMDDGRTVRCNAKHLWKVKYEGKEEIVTTQFMIDHPEIEFEIPSI